MYETHRIKVLAKTRIKVQASTGNIANIIQMHYYHKPFHKIRGSRKLTKAATG